MIGSSASSDESTVVWKVSWRLKRITVVDACQPSEVQSSALRAAFSGGVLFRDSLLTRLALALRLQHIDSTVARRYRRET